jgi:hypothetical protein
MGLSVVHRYIFHSSPLNDFILIKIKSLLHDKAGAVAGETLNENTRFE